MTHHQQERAGPGGQAHLDLLFVAAHPDDELLACGTLMRAADEGARVGLLVLSCGSGGRDVLGVGERELPNVRHAEVLAAGRLIGVKYLRVFRHEDARPVRRPRPGSPTRPSQFVGGLQDHLASIETILTTEFARHRPRRIITFGPDGFNGHPDHVAVHHATHTALARTDHDGALDYVTLDRPLSPDVAGTWRPATHHADVSDLLLRKLRVMGVYRSQALTVTDFFLSNARQVLLTEAFRSAERRPAPPVTRSALPHAVTLST